MGLAIWSVYFVFNLWLGPVDFALQAIQRSQLRIIEDAGHMVMMEQPEQVNKCLHDFLSTSQPASELGEK